MEIGAWVYSIAYQQMGQVIQTQQLWGDTICRIWLPTSDTIVQVRADSLKLATKVEQISSDHLSYVAAAARIAEALAQPGVLLAPLSASIIPLPHQIRALQRAISGDRVRYLLADEVGLGKTIEAGLILRELKLRGLARRCLIIVPKGLVSQWAAELKHHFGEDFQIILPGEFAAYRRFTQAENLWQAYDQVICPLDSVKPLDKRRGWSSEQVAEHNRDRFEGLLAAGWDLVVFDEAHRLGGSTDQIARYRLGQELAQVAPYLLLLSATPHQGKTDAFYRLVALLDTQAFPDLSSVTRARVQPYVIRTEKRQAIDAQGQPLFKPRQTRLLPVAWTERHRQQRLLYEAVTEYVRAGYNQALREKKNYVGFLMILMQRLVTSSTQAIRTTLERRLEVLRAPVEQLSFLALLDEEEWVDLDGQEQLDFFLKTRLAALKNERAEVELLLEVARRAEASEPDAKAEALLAWLYRLQQEETDPDLKLLIFTEFVPTQAMLYDFLTQRGIKAVCLNGSMSLDERQQAQTAFATDSRVLISTDAGGEGLNLQFCHVVINYDLPWNPMRLEQRIGRLDRIGQTHVVRALNFVLEDTVEHRVQEVLVEKLKLILAEFGVDKTSDVLDSVQAERLFDELYIEAIRQPDHLDDKIEAVVREIQDQAYTARDRAVVTGLSETFGPELAERVLNHPLPHWLERMTVSYLAAHGGQAERRGTSWHLRWPDGETVEQAVFTAKEVVATPTARHLSLSEDRLRELTTHLPPFVAGQPIPCLSLPGLPEGLRGFWSLWRITLHAREWSQQRLMPLFLRQEDQRLFLPTARFIWDQLLQNSVVISRYIGSEGVFEPILETAEAQGRTIYEELVRNHQDRLRREQEKGVYAFDARRQALDRIGLPAVRAYRLARLTEEETAWREQIAQRSQVSPELVALLVIQVTGNG